MKCKGNRRPIPLDVLILDMDGVLIDVTKSYRETIKKTVQLYLEDGLGFKGGKGVLVSDKDISLFKEIGGFNNDWDLTSGLLLYFLSLSNLVPPLRKSHFHSIGEAIQYLRFLGSNCSNDIETLLKKKDIPDFKKRLAKTMGGLKGVSSCIDPAWKNLVYGSGDLNGENVVKRIFQEVYLGKRFQSHYHLRPIFYRGEGLYTREKLLIKKDTLKELSRYLRLGIASGRPRMEARWALKQFGIENYIQSLVTLDDCQEEEERVLKNKGRRVHLSKPHPFSILESIRKITPEKVRSAYVGDVVDDMLAANKAKKKVDILAIGCTGPGRNQSIRRKALIHAGADLVIQNPEELLHLVV